MMGRAASAARAARAASSGLSAEELRDTSPPPVPSGAIPTLSWPPEIGGLYGGKFRSHTTAFHKPCVTKNTENSDYLPYHERQSYRIVSNKRPGGVAIFQKGMFIRGKFSMQKGSV